jgi:hypothetical protein
MQIDTNGRSSLEVREVNRPVRECLLVLSSDRLFFPASLVDIPRKPFLVHGSAGSGCLIVARLCPSSRPARFAANQDRPIPRLSLLFSPAIPTFLTGFFSS